MSKYVCCEQAIFILQDQNFAVPFIPINKELRAIFLSVSYVCTRSSFLNDQIGEFRCAGGLLVGGLGKAPSEMRSIPVSRPATSASRCPGCHGNQDSLKEERYIRQAISFLTQPNPHHSASLDQRLSSFVFNFYTRIEFKPESKNSQPNSVIWEV